MSPSSSEPDVAHPARTYHAENISVMGDETTFGRGATKLLSNLSRRTHKQRVPGDSCTITGWRLILITIAMMLGFLFTEMDRQWFDTAIPRVTSEFHSLDQAAWYQTAYDLPRLAALPIYGRVYTLFPLKITYCVNVLIFLLGSFVCGFAPNSHTLIIGRAIQGWGNAGMNSGAFIIICLIASRIRMPLFLATIVLMGSVAAAAGPPLGGIFAESTYTWRLGFRLNIALVAFNGTLIAFALREPERLVATNSLKDRLKALDPRGASLILGSMTCLTLALQWGGSDIAWSDSKVIGCFIGFGLMMVLFLYLQVKEGDEALIPVHILTQRTVGFACLSSVFTVMAFSVVSRFMPFYFQAVRGLSPRASGVYILALAIPDPLVAFGIAALVTLTGYYIPFIMACGGMLAVGSGLLSTLQVHTDMARVIGYELLMAISLGLGVQLPLSAVRNVLVKADVPTGNALVLFSMSMGSVLAVPISQTIFMNVLRHHLQTRLSPGEVREIIRLGPSGVQPDILGPDLVPFVAESYNAAIVTAFRLAIATATMALFAAASMEWKRLGDDDAIVLVARGSSELPIVPERPASGEIQLEESISFSHVEEVVSGDGAIHCRCREQEKGRSLV